MQGMTGLHSNSREDRRYKLKCCKIQVPTGTGSSVPLVFSASVSRGPCTLHGWLNGLDNVLNWQCPSGTFMSGMYSEHYNKQEDRRFKFYCCPVQVSIRCEAGRFSDSAGRSFCHKTCPRDTHFSYKESSKGSRYLVNLARSCGLAQNEACPATASSEYFNGACPAEVPEPPGLATRHSQHAL